MILLSSILLCDNTSFFTSSHFVRYSQGIMCLFAHAGAMLLGLSTGNLF